MIPSPIMAALTLVKLGGSVLTEKTAREALRSDVLARLCAELASGLPEACIVGHGSGSFGHRAAVEHGCADGVFAESQAAAAAATREAALRLHGLVLNAFEGAGVDAVSVPPADCCHWRDGRLQADLEPVRRVLGSGAVPLVMGDVIARVEGGAKIASTEVVLVALAGHLPVERAIWVGDTDGVLDDEGASLPSLTSAAEPRFEMPAGADVTGGMSGRWEAVRALASRGVESVLVNGLREGQLRAALAGDAIIGTRVAPDAESV